MADLYTPKVDTVLALELVKARLNRLDNTLDDYLTHRILAAEEYITGQGIHLGWRPGDQMLLVDVAVWQYNSRDVDTGEPEWLRYKIRQRWLQERGDQQ